jgi:hypothetical protein
MSVMAEAERVRLLAMIRALLRTCPETATGTFNLPVVTGVDRGIRHG